VRESQSFLHMGPDALERFLLEKARSDAAPHGARQRALARVAVVGAGGAALTGAVAAHGAAATSIGKALASSVSLGIGAKWLGVGIAAGLVAMGVGEGVRQADKAREKAAPVVVGPAADSRVSTAPPREAVRPHSVEEPVDEPSRLSPWPSSAALAPPKREHRGEDPAGGVIERTPREPSLAPEPAPSMRASSQLPRELELLDGVRIALRDHAPARGLDALNCYEAEFPTGRLSIEATALRVEVMIDLGQFDRARELGRDFLASNPQSPAAVRVRSRLQALDSAARKP
jgi:hypothetical protein